MTHWQHPRFHAYFPAGNSYPSILGDMLGDAIGCVGFSWVYEKPFQKGLKNHLKTNLFLGCRSGLYGVGNHRFGLVG